LSGYINIVETRNAWLSKQLAKSFFFKKIVGHTSETVPLMLIYASFFYCFASLVPFWHFCGYGGGPSCFLINFLHQLQTLFGLWDKVASRSRTWVGPQKLLCNPLTKN